MENKHYINQQFDGFFKESFENFEPELPQGTWENIDQSVSQSVSATVAGSAKVFSSVFLKMLAVLLPLAGAIYVVTRQNDTSPKQTTQPVLSLEQQTLAEPSGEHQTASEVEKDIETNYSNDKIKSTAVDSKKVIPESGSTATASRNSNALPKNQTSRTVTDMQPPVSNTNANLPKENPGEHVASKNNSLGFVFTVSRTDVCTDENIEFNTTSAGFDRYRWDFDDGHYYDQHTAGKVTHKFDKAGWYNVTLLGYKGTHTQRYSVRLRVIKPMAYFVVKAEQAPKLQFVNQSTHAQQYEWDFGDHSISREANPSHIFEADTKLWVRLIARNGTCADTFSLEVNTNSHAANEDKALQIPNVFTPNQDGINDEWGLIHLEGELRITVLDRSGRKIFEAADAGKKWNGTDVYGKECPSGDYFYIIHCKSNDGRETTRTGLIKLMR